MTTTWNPSDKTSGVTLSNGDLSAGGNSGYTYGLGRAVNGFDSGKKVYFEVVIDAFTSSASNWIVGGCQSSSATTAGLFDGGIRAFGAGTQSGNTSLWAWNDGAPVGSALGTPAVNDVVGICVDRVNNRFWARLNTGNWNGSGTADPATNTGGLDISLCTNPFPAYTLISTAEDATARFSRTSWTYAAPAGFVEINAPTAAALNPSDVAGGTPTFSNSNKTIASATDGVGMWSRSSGGGSSKFYFECYVTGNTAVEYAVTNATQDITVTGDVAPNKGIAIYANTTWNYYSDNIPDYSQISTGIGSAGDRICVAVDPVNGRIWARLNNGNWNNSGTANPATNTGGVNISSVGSKLYAVAKSSYTYISASVYLAQADWLYSAPVGFDQVLPEAPRTLYTQSSAFQTFPVAAVAGSNYNESTSESAATSDSPASIATFPRSVAESVATADSQSTALVGVNTVSESIATADSPASIATFPRSVAESVATSDTQAGIATYPASTAESIATSDSQTAALTVLGTVAESVATADTPAAIGTFTRSVAESTATSDTQSGIATYPASTAESVATSDSQVGGAAYTDSVGESVATADTTAATTTRVGSVAESIATADAQTSILTAVGSVAESVATADSQTNVATFTRAVDETMAAADAVADTGAALSETVATSDSTAGLVTSTNSVAESLAAADTTTATMVRTGAVAESVATADSQTNVVVFPRSVAESVATADTQTAGVIYLVACNENVATADAQSVFGSAQESVAESVAIADTVVSAGGVFTVSQTEVVTITDDVALYEFWDIITTGTGETWSDISSPATENWSGIATGSASWSNINTTPKTWDDITSTPETWTDIDAA